jgi:hypothetical protein
MASRGLLFVLLVGSYQGEAAPKPVQAPLAVQQTTTPTSKASDPNRKICKSQSTIGSLARTKKVCHTRAEWKALDPGPNAPFGEFQNQRQANSTIGG